MIRRFENRAEQQISGFQSPAADYLEGRLNIADKLVVDPHSTFYFQMSGEALNSKSIHDGDLLIIDRGLMPVDGALVIAFHEGHFTCRIFRVKGLIRSLYNDLDEIVEREDQTLQIWGVISSVCRNVLPKTLKKGRYKDVCTL